MGPILNYIQTHPWHAYYLDCASWIMGGWILTKLPGIIYRKVKSMDVFSLIIFCFWISMIVVAIVRGKHDY
jgi:hypothetical protein